jgi:hypothetical protein
MVASLDQYSFGSCRREGRSAHEDPPLCRETLVSRVLSSLLSPKNAHLSAYARTVGKPELASGPPLTEHDLGVKQLACDESDVVSGLPPKAVP